MPFWRLYYHLVWGTKHRAPLIQSEIENTLYSYLVRKASELDVSVYAINGWHDYVHLVVSIPPKHAVAYVVKCLKGASSHYLNHMVGLDHRFNWQRGYGALGIGSRQRSSVEAYVAGQKQHHSDQTIIGRFERYAELDEGPDYRGKPV